MRRNLLALRRSWNTVFIVLLRRNPLFLRASSSTPVQGVVEPSTSSSLRDTPTSGSRMDRGHHHVFIAPGLLAPLSVDAFESDLTRLMLEFQGPAQGFFAIRVSSVQEQACSSGPSLYHVQPGSTCEWYGTREDRQPMRKFVRVDASHEIASQSGALVLSSVPREDPAKSNVPCLTRSCRQFILKLELNFWLPRGTYSYRNI